MRCLSVHVHAPPQVCKYWNGKRRAQAGEEASYDDETLDSLLMRFEEPNAMTRWDSPLIIVPTILSPATNSNVEGAPIDDSSISVEPVPYDDIWDAATKDLSTKPPKSSHPFDPPRPTTSPFWNPPHKPSFLASYNTNPRSVCNQGPKCPSIILVLLGPFRCRSHHQGTSR